jgi:hypothetical protein
MKELCKNPNATDVINKLIEEYPEKINWKSIAQNPSIHLLNVNNINFSNSAMKRLAQNPNGINIFKQLTDNYIKYFDELGFNDSLEAINILKTFPSEMFDDDHLFILCNNKYIMEIVDKFYDRLDWFIISLNKHAIPLIEENILNNKGDMIQYTICGNDNAIHIIKNFYENNNNIIYEPDTRRIFSSYLTTNTNIFEIDRVRMYKEIDEEIDNLFNLV